MPAFDYKAKSNTGEIVSGRFDAQNRETVLSLLRDKGYYPINIQEVKTYKKDIDLSVLQKVSAKDLSILCRQFQTMLNAGVTLLGSLELLRKQTSNPKLAKVLNIIFDDVQKGRSLSNSLRNHPKVFPVIMVSMVEAGEISGNMDNAMEKLADNFEKDNKIKQKIKGATAYPKIIGILAMVAVVFLTTAIVPKFAEMFATTGSELPLPTRILLAISDAFKDWRFDTVLVLLIIGMVIGFNKLKSTERGKGIIDGIILKLPIVGINVKKILASRFTRTLSSLLSSGVPLIQALDVVEKVLGNQVLAEGMAKVKDEIQRGSNLAAPLEAMGIFPPMVTQMVSIGEESGSLDTIMRKVADFYDDEVDSSVSQLLAIIEPLMIFGLALIVGFIVVAMIMPMFAMYGTVA